MSGISHSTPVDDPWLSFLHVARPRLDLDELEDILCIDPGETTGWASFVKGQLVNAGQWSTLSPSEMAKHVKEADEAIGFGRIVYEEYRVRGNKFKEHVGSEVLTIQNIGAIKVAAGELEIPLTKQTAGMAKNFATDHKLRRWGLYRPGYRHANDAIRHGVYYILFGKHYANVKA